MGNKCDLFSIETVSEKEAKHYAKENGAGFFLTSAKDGTGIPRAFQAALEMRIASNPNLKEKVYGIKLSKKEHNEQDKQNKKRCCN